MKVTDTMTVELTLVYDVNDMDDVKTKSDYEDMLKNIEAVVNKRGQTIFVAAFDDAHVNKLKHFISEVER